MSLFDSGPVTIALSGKFVGVNKWHGARRIGSRASIYKTPEYQEFVDYIVSKCPKLDSPMGPDISVKISLYINTRRDIDSILKPLLDAVVKAGVIRDDVDVKVLHAIVVGRVKMGQEEHAIVTIQEGL